MWTPEGNRIIDSGGDRWKHVCNGTGVFDVLMDQGRVWGRREVTLGGGDGYGCFFGHCDGVIVHGWCCVRGDFELLRLAGGCRLVLMSRVGELYLEMELLRKG